MVGNCSMLNCDILHVMLKTLILGSFDIIIPNYLPLETGIEYQTYKPLLPFYCYYSDDLRNWLINNVLHAYNPINGHFGHFWYNFA